MQLALDAGVETLVLFHHEPRRTDDQLDQQLALCRQLVQDRGATLNVVGGFVVTNRMLEMFKKRN